jgi:hypothetical protein
MTIHTTSNGLTWVRKDNLEMELGETIYLAPKDDISLYEQVEPYVEEEEEFEDK